MPLTSEQKAQARSIAEDLTGMVADPNIEGGFRLAEIGETPLSRQQRRHAGRAYAMGASPEEITEVLAGW